MNEQQLTEQEIKFIEREWQTANPLNARNITETYSNIMGMLNKEQPDIEQQLSEAIHKTLVVQNKESVEKYCVPELLKVFAKTPSYREAEFRAELEKAKDLSFEWFQQKERIKSLEEENEKLQQQLEASLFDKKKVAEAFDAGYSCGMRNDRMPGAKENYLNNLK